MALNNQEKILKEFLMASQDTDGVSIDDLDKNLTNIAIRYVEESLKGTNIEGSRVTIENDERVDDSRYQYYDSARLANSDPKLLKIGNEVICQTNFKLDADSLINKDGNDDRLADIAYEFFTEANSKITQLKKEYNSRNFEITRGENDIVSALTYAKYDLLGNHAPIENDSSKEAIVTTTTQLLRVMKSLKMDIDYSSNIAKRGSEELYDLISDKQTINSLDMLEVDEIIRDNPDLIKEYDILRVEYNPNGTRKSLGQLLEDKKEYQKNVQENDAIKSKVTRNSLLNQVDRGLTHVEYNELVSQYIKGNIDNLIDEYGEESLLQQVNEIEKFKNKDDKKIELRKNNIEKALERNEELLKEELSYDVYSELKESVLMANEQRNIIEDYGKIDEKDQEIRENILNKIKEELEYRKNEKEVQKQEPVAEHEQEEPKQEPTNDKKEPNITNVFINIDNKKTKTDNSTKNKTDNSTKTKTIDNTDNSVNEYYNEDDNEDPSSKPTGESEKDDKEKKQEPDEHNTQTHTGDKHIEDEDKKSPTNDTKEKPKDEKERKKHEPKEEQPYTHTKEPIEEEPFMPPFTDPIDIVEEPIEPKEKIENPKTDDREHSNKETEDKDSKSKNIEEKESDEKSSKEESVDFQNISGTLNQIYNDFKNKKIKEIDGKRVEETKRLYDEVNQMEQKGFITAENANLYLDEKIAKLDEEMGDKMDSLYEKLDEIYNNTTTLLKRAKEDKQVAINLNNRINIIKQKREKAKMQEEKINTFKSDGTLSMLEEVEHRKEESTLNKKKEDEIKKGEKKEYDPSR